MFFLGTHKPHWLWLTTVPLFVSHRRLVERKSLERATCSWALDSGGFTELKLFGRWETLPKFYADKATEYQETIGSLRWAAPQDWMCEPIMLEKTGRTIYEHQQLTIESVHSLRALAPSVPWAPVVQGWRPDDYLAHVEQYAASGINLRAEPIVGVGSVCRRQATEECVGIFASLHKFGLKLHGFGLKLDGVANCWPWLESSDSLAWSLGARLAKPLEECSHKSCQNCLRYALLWRERVVKKIGRECQLVML